MGYADRQLTTGETISYRARQHWLAIVVNGFKAWLLLVLGVAIAAASTQVKDPVWVQQAILYVGLGLTGIAVLWILLMVWDWLNEEYLVTTRRVIKVQGILNKRLGDSSLEKINDAAVEQNLVGRIFGYADLDILTANDQAFDRFRMLARALDFHKAILEAKHTYEIEIARGGGTVGPARMTSDEVAAALDDLAGLRDRGAISPVDFEAKKAELLARL